MDAANDAIERVREADRRSLTAQLAFAVGKFDEYCKAEGDAALRRIEALYGSYSGTQPATDGG